MDDLSAFLHSSAWERFQIEAGATTTRSQHNLCVARPLPFGGTYWLLSRARFDADWTPQDPLSHSWFLRVEPNDQASLERVRMVSRSLGAKLIRTASVQPRQTMYVDLRHSQADLLHAMKPKHRYNIRLAERRGVHIEIYRSDLSQHFPRFWHLLSATAHRQQFRTHAKSYYETMLRELEKDGMLRLGFATFEGKDIATVLILAHEKTATYLHGASDNTFRHLMGPFLLHWHAMNQVKKEGFHFYDFWGTSARRTASDQWEADDSQGAGTTRFKLGFGGTVLDYPGTYDVVLKPFWYTVYKVIRGLRSRKRAFS